MSDATRTIAVVDSGYGNLRSVEKALQHVGLATARTRDAAQVRAATHVVVPGVGAFGDFLAALRAEGLDAAVRDRHAAGRPTRDGASWSTPTLSPTCDPGRGHYGMVEPSAMAQSCGG